ncbi:MAG: RAD55 family ATPase [Thermoplasmata archaeon]
MFDSFPLNSTCLITGPPGVGKFEYCCELAIRFIKQRGRVVFVAIDVDPAEVRRLATRRGMDISRSRKSIFVHCVSPYVPASPCCELAHDCCVKSDTTVESVATAIGRAISYVGEPTRAIVFTASSLLLYNSPKDVIKLCHLVANQVKSEYGFVTFVLHSGVHSPDLQVVLRSFVDGVINWRFGENLRREYRVSYYRGLSTSPLWREFHITKAEGPSEAEETPPLWLVQKEMRLDGVADDEASELL